MSVTSTSTTVINRANAGATILIQGLMIPPPAAFSKVQARWTNGDVIGQQSSATGSATPTINTLNKAIIPFVIVDSGVAGTGHQFRHHGDDLHHGQPHRAPRLELLTNALPVAISKTVNWQSATTFLVSDTAGLAQGQSVSGLGIAAGATNIISAAIPVTTTTACGATGYLITIAGTTAAATGTTNLVFSAGASGAGSSGIANLNFTGATALDDLECGHAGQLANHDRCRRRQCPDHWRRQRAHARQRRHPCHRQRLDRRLRHPRERIHRRHAVRIHGLRPRPDLPRHRKQHPVRRPGHLRHRWPDQGRGGTLALSAQELYIGQTTINGGTLQLSSTTPNTLFLPFSTAPAAGATVSIPNSQIFQINAGGTLDLNGSNQIVSNLQQAGSNLPFTGGVVKNTGAAATFYVSPQASQTWAGNISGANINLVRASGNT